MMVDMDNQSGGGSAAMGNLFGSLQRSNAAQLSPYLNVDPSYLQSATPEFILNEDNKRGRMENSFTAIGSSVIIGSTVGGLYGLFDGMRKTADMKGRLRRTQVTNYTLKSGGSVSNSLGTVAVIYSSLYSLISLQHEDDDEIKSIVTGGLTGALYKSSAGLRKCGMAGAFGLGLATLWVMVLKKDERVSNYM
ncbi:hypothetical protein TCAL_09993 [Tigriopus californicus]|uniref:Mitochondrial import inner membrane translocase subunit TIM23 n=1 Tax=Tigriopus californicus TaxID=6832 RepID=A0A553PQ57_TIGCA|nr:mitochondrial import inner membrane translocase subunit Tim23-like [Tigriopus californicus]TRY79791.1 hypothetical protein TCAL_09993 [Tigriopus californicus]